MGIQQRLLEARYGNFNVRMPEKREVNLILPKPNNRQRINLNLLEISKQVLFQYANPTKKDRYYKTNQQKIVSDFIGYLNKNHNSKAQLELVHYRLIRPLVYFYLNPTLYGNNFQNFAVSWYVNALFGMRHYTMRCMRDEGLIPPITTFTATYTNGYYHLVKPMKASTNLYNAMRLHDLLFHSVEYYFAKILKQPLL